MGNAEKRASKVRVTDGSTMRLSFETEQRAFDGQHPIIGTVNINTKTSIAAYGVILTLYCKDRSIKITRGKNGEPHVHNRTVIAFEQSKVIHNFEDNVCPLGMSSYPFTFEVPENLPQSSNY